MMDRDRDRPDNGRGRDSPPEILAAWVHTYERHYQELALYLAGRLGSSHDVEDLLQEVFLRLMALDHVPQNPRAYLYTVARSCLHAHRREQRTHAATKEYRVVNRLIMGDPRAAAEKEPWEGLCIQEQHQAVLAALKRLPAGYAEVLELRVIMTLPLEEAARRAGCSPQAFRKRLQRAKRYLAEFFPQVP